MGKIVLSLADAGLVAVVARSPERPSREIRLWLCRQRPSSWLSMADRDGKRQCMVPNSHGKKWMCKPYPTSQGGPEIKYLLQGEMSGKGNLLAKISRPLGTSLAWRTLFWASMTIGRVSLM